MKNLVFLCLFLSCANELVIQREVNTCVTSEEYSEVFVVKRQRGWSIWLKEVGDKDNRIMHYVNDKKWKSVECPTGPRESK